MAFFSTQAYPPRWRVSRLRMLELEPGRLRSRSFASKLFACHLANYICSSIWLIELSKMLPSSTQLDGFDVDLTQFPPKQWLPSNVAMHKLDAFSTSTQDFAGKYDIVHLRLFTVLIKSNDPVPLLRNLIGMLSKDRVELTGPNDTFLACHDVTDLLTCFTVQSQVVTSNGTSMIMSLKKSSLLIQLLIPKPCMQCSTLSDPLTT